ncbi:ester cyclase [Nocardia sp. NBC_00508]|uniref:ester cyclase n=1 Tax=Nocardia sp. NBC_00508 TaxID=2975992 RepID=UPI002E801F2C|nr:ester cyclase [Nocardia sp. NBC_00508]WUD66472.1 ester cyclase [Nocardia sp. NBC_00508]
MSSAQEASNKAIFTRFHDAMNTGDPEVISQTIDEIVEPEVLLRIPLPVAATGAHAVKQVWAMLLRVFPDVHVAVQDLIAAGDTVVGRSVVTGTHEGEFMGVAPTGKSVTYNEIFIFRFANGRITEISGVVDGFALMQQLGVVPVRATGVPSAPQL